MKTKIVQLAAFLFKKFLQFIYWFLKRFPVKKNKVLFCSRQSDDPSLDFLLIRKELIERGAVIDYVTICCKIEKNIGSYAAFFKELIRSMYHLATTPVCIIDSYWPAVSMLHHKKELKVIQIWHAVGKIKKSGYQAAGAISGRRQEYTSIFNMHENYDYVIAGGKAWNRFYCQSFNISEEKLLNYGLPRLDYLIDTESDNRERFFSENPQLADKKIILYAPTFRRNMTVQRDGIIEAADSEKVALIIKDHPIERCMRNDDKENIYYFDDWKTMDLIAVCDYLITDYSAIAVEGAAIGKKTYYWVYDYEAYVENNGLNIDLFAEMPGCVFRDGRELLKSIEQGKYNEKAFENYRKKYLPEELGKSTEKIADLVEKLLSVNL